MRIWELATVVRTTNDVGDPVSAGVPTPRQLNRMQDFVVESDVHIAGPWVIFDLGQYCYFTDGRLLCRVVGQLYKTAGHTNNNNNNNYIAVDVVW